MRREEIVALDKKFVWHPYTPMERYIRDIDPFVIDRAEGSWLIDKSGERFIDANASWWVSSLGHNHPRLVAALTDQASRMCHVSLAGTTHELCARLASEVVARAPRGLAKVFFSDDGSTAVEAAIKMSLGFHRNRGNANRRRFVALSSAFHGETLGVTSLGGVDVFRVPFASVLMECVHLPSPADDPEAAVRALEMLFEREGDEIAALVIEPLLQGAGGMRMYPASVLSRLRELTAQHGVLLVVDEVFTGYGRTGPFWACEHASISPDILCTAKGFSGGVLPMAATLVTEEVFDAFLGPPENAFFYGHSFGGNPLGARVALEVLSVYDDEAILAGTAPRGAAIATAMSRIARRDARVLRPRQLGVVGAVDLASDGKYLSGTGPRVTAEARKRGAYVRPLGDVVYVAPPLNISMEDLESLLLIVEESILAALG